MAKVSKKVTIAGEYSLATVYVDNDAHIDVAKLRLSWSSTSKLKIQSRADGKSYHTLGSLPEQLYGSKYRNARHVHPDVYNLTRSAFAPSKVRLQQMGL